MTARASGSQVGALFVAVSVVLGAAFAAAAPDDKTDKPAPSTSAAPSGPSTASGPAPGTMTFTTGVSPMPAGSAVPKKFLPPGAETPDQGPSLAVFPSQKLTVRFNHKTHVVGQKLSCTYCHSNAEKSVQASDNLLPKKHDLCSDCHSIDESEPWKDEQPVSRCDGCHVGAKPGPSGAVQVAKTVLPQPNLKMNHKIHIAKGIKCQECHGEVGQLELATRDQMPRMKGCFNCHQGSDAGGLGKNASAKSECKTCHLQEKDGTLKTMFVSGVMMPPKWLRNSSHGADWIERHKKVAGADSQYCASCHTEAYCVACHDGKVRPRSIHPNDWLSMHSVAGLQDAPKCQACHSTTNFCMPCHTRVGIATQSGPSVAALVRFHPPASVWSAPKRVPGHHSYEAQKNINACVSCHVERDCVVCHGTNGVGGTGANPHGPSFAAKCATMYDKNPRPCFVCHEFGDRHLKQCE